MMSCHVPPHTLLIYPSGHSCSKGWLNPKGLTVRRSNADAAIAYDGCRITLDVNEVEEEDEEVQGGGSAPYIIMKLMNFNCAMSPGQTLL